MGLIDQTSSEYYDGEIVYTPNGNVTNNLIWPNNMTPLIWDNSATPTSYDNYEVYVDSIQQYPTLSPYYITQVLTSTITDGVIPWNLSLTSNPDPDPGIESIVIAPKSVCVPARSWFVFGGSVRTG